ncbi:MAG: phosphoribosylformylglycinamidine synthase subunit PurQ [Thermoplasmata archaeon]
MKIENINVCILQIEGTNCDRETSLAFQRLGAKVETVHLKQLIGSDTDKGEKRDLFDYQVVMIPGGFSSGDYVRGGAIFSARMKSTLKDQLIKFVEEGYPIGGICNGFQVLVEIGLLPAFNETMSEYPESVLTTNDSSRFECRPTLLKHENNGNCVFTQKIPRGKIIMAPSAHAEGKFLLPLEQTKKLLQKLIDNDQIVFRYVDEKGNYAGYPYNPNGALYNIAGICNRQGNVFGMMPHPERSFYKHTYPDWTRTGLGDNKGDGRLVFESVLEYVSSNF